MSDGLEMKYFVLKPRGRDDYARASRMAMREYAMRISKVNEKLSDQLFEWADKEQKIANAWVSGVSGGTVTVDD